MEFGNHLSYMGKWFFYAHDEAMENVAGAMLHRRENVPWHIHYSTNLKKRGERKCLRFKER